MQFIDKFKEYFPCMLRLDDGTEKPQPCYFIDSSGNAHKMTPSAFSDMLQKLIHPHSLEGAFLVPCSRCDDYSAKSLKPRQAFLPEPDFLLATDWKT